ncbi:MAG: flavodoxin domain-containing protein [Anaeroplasmataceae bacterium]|nr:flavodoxin domain-containing protein [Anaeroplasmataceae bacterium]
MKLILYFGHTGTTKKAAMLLQERLKDTVVMDGTKKNKIQFTDYDAIIFGVNIRGGKLNKKFVKFYKKLIKKESPQTHAAFIVAGDENRKAMYMNLARDLLKQDSYIGFFGGEFDPTHAKGITRAILVSCRQTFIDRDLPLPSLKMDAIEDFAAHLNAEIE